MKASREGRYFRVTNIIQFPSRKASTEFNFQDRFFEKTENLAPQLVECLKEMYDGLMAEGFADMPDFEVCLSEPLQASQVEQIKNAVASLMDSHQARALALLKRIMELEAKLCVQKHQSNLTPIR